MSASENPYVQPAPCCSSYRRHALRKYETYFHALCWPLAALPTGALVWFSRAKGMGGVESFCALSLTYSEEFLLCFHLPLLAAVSFNLLIYFAVIHNSREHRVSTCT